MNIIKFNKCPGESIYVFIFFIIGSNYKATSSSHS